MSGAGAASRVRATAGVTTVWGRALRAELVKVVTLPAMWWSAAVAGAAAVATMMSVLRDVVDGRGLDFEEVAPVWALAVQIGFVAAGVAAAGAEHSTAQGMTSLLVMPARGRLAVARLMVLTGAGLVAASVLVGVSLAACPATSTEALWAGGRTVVWLTAVLLLSAGLGAALRSVIGASTAAVVLVVWPRSWPCSWATPPAGSRARRPRSGLRRTHRGRTSPLPDSSSWPGRRPPR